MARKFYELHKLLCRPAHDGNGKTSWVGSDIRFYDSFTITKAHKWVFLINDTLSTCESRIIMFHDFDLAGKQ